MCLFARPVKKEDTTVCSVWFHLWQEMDFVKKTKNKKKTKKLKKQNKNTQSYLCYMDRDSHERRDCVIANQCCALYAYIYSLGLVSAVPFVFFVSPRNLLAYGTILRGTRVTKSDAENLLTLEGKIKYKQIHFALFERRKKGQRNTDKNYKNEHGIRCNSSICEATLEYMEM